MKKTLIISALALSAFSYAFAEDASTTMPAALPPVISTGSSTIDAQIKALRAEMETKIKALRDEYQVKLKAIIANAKTLRSQGGATTTVKEIRKEIKDIRKDNMEVRKEARVQGDSTTTVALPSEMNQKLMNLFRSFLGR
ncbi:MAG: hypothetical protein ACAH17_02650 [Candidatus Paceibacterota bacterium]